jgi:hypothetical protein
MVCKSLRLVTHITLASSQSIQSTRPAVQPVVGTMKLHHALALVLAAESAAAFLSAGCPRTFVSTSYPKPKHGLFGSLMDEINSGAYDLQGSGSGERKIDMNNAYETFLADLVFSTNDPRMDIMNKFDLATDQEFLDWLDRKINNSKDPEERIALRDLFEMIEDIKTRVEVSRLAEERLAREASEAEEKRIAEAEVDAEEGRSMTTADILKKARQIQTASSDEETTKKKPKVSFYESEITPEIRLSYEPLLKKVLPPYKAGMTPLTVVRNYYDQFDAQFVKVLSERSSNGEEDSKLVLEALAVEQQQRIETATSAIKSVLSLGDPRKMEGAIVKMAREGQIDEAFLLLLEANENQAKDAGATGPAQLMERLRKRAMEEKDKQASSKEVALIRKLLRTAEANEREKILEDAFTPRASLLVAGTAENAAKAMDGTAPDQEKPMPDVPPPDFINACKAVLLNFGNLKASPDDNDEDLATRIRKIAAEAEVVATRIYGQGMTLREQQDRMWEQQTTSIFDLEKLEIEAERNGEVAPWANPNNEDIFMPGFDKDGRMQVGGG